MTVERTQVLWIEQRADYSVHEVGELSGLPHALLEQLVACGALPASGGQAAHLSSEGVVLARAAGRLRRHFELDDDGLAVAVSLLRRVRVLEAELSRVRAMPRDG